MEERGSNFAQDEHGEEDVLFTNDGKGNFTPRPPPLIRCVGNPAL